MGQYYSGIILASKKRNYPNKKKILACINSWDYNNGAKLVEHSYINNDFVNAFEELINKEHGKYRYQPVVWAGDYAEEEPLTYNKENLNLHALAYEFEDKVRIKNLVGKHYRYIINEDKKRYIDTQNPKVIGTNITEGKHIKYYLHPLPLMICEGNGQGGGDVFASKSLKQIGKWARDIVVVSDNKPDDTYKELVVTFTEEWDNNR